MTTAYTSKKVWVMVKDNLGKMGKWFERSEDDFVMGREPCFADMAVITNWISTRSTRDAIACSLQADLPHLPFFDR
ncbi:uncharacterized protein BT62DRAFT_1011996 [Guyanagaster necrorhizus]|uniref:Glutathione S-transferase UstS-like C-terminal domain-containing protein n=1 Tax=Guyanagaster necrorhizus TaxID=856835 RepID=A0A9P7VIE0_9AGAR|nr:uncharacterized protein BT62DRAFT_1011996 [Guyanagaster necrorhizus MCA 3950]KAG7441182.1 hypothetical protein BT62DRAFT_1011996 [Guyanagaster necrorhizus MCA 3950]